MKRGAQGTKNRREETWVRNASTWRPTGESFELIGVGSKGGRERRLSGSSSEMDHSEDPFPVIERETRSPIAVSDSVGPRNRRDEETSTRERPVPASTHYELTLESRDSDSKCTKDTTRLKETTWALPNDPLRGFQPPAASRRPPSGLAEIGGSRLGKKPWADLPTL